MEKLLTLSKGSHCPSYLSQNIFKTIYTTKFNQLCPGVQTKPLAGFQNGQSLRGQPEIQLPDTMIGSKSIHQKKNPGRFFSQKKWGFFSTKKTTLVFHFQAPVSGCLDLLNYCIWWFLRVCFKSIRSTAGGKTPTHPAIQISLICNMKCSYWVSEGNAATILSNIFFWTNGKHDRPELNWWNWRGFPR